jgi:DNA-binding IscR family transcriptional regulator
MLIDAPQFVTATGTVINRSRHDYELRLDSPAVPHPTNTQFALAVHMLTLLSAETDAMHSSEVLAASAGSNPVHVRRVLGRLRRAGLVRSRPGPHGGWLVDGATCDTTLAEVWDAVHGDDPVLGLHSANPDCVVGQRIQGALVELDRRAARALTAELAETTLGDLVRSTEAAPATAAAR